MAATNFALFIIDSLTYGSHASSGAGTITGTTYPAVALGLLGDHWTGANQGVAGLKLADALLTPYPAQYAAAYDPGTYTGRNVAVLMALSNDINAGTSVATNKANYAAAVAMLRGTIGFEVVAATISPASQQSGHFIPLTFNATAATLNAWIRENWAALGCVALADIAADGRIGYAGAELDPRYYVSDPDSGHDDFYIHNIDAGYAIRAGIVAAAIATPARVSSTAPAGMANMLAGADFRVGVWTTSALSTQAVATDPLGGWTSGVGNNATQATSGNRPTLQANGVQFGASKSLGLLPPVSVVDFELDVVLTRTTGTNVFLLGSSTTDQGVVLASTDTLYVVGPNGFAGLALNLVGTDQHLRVRRRDGVCYAAAPGFPETVLTNVSGTPDGTMVVDVVGARTFGGGVGASYTDSTARIKQFWMAARDLTKGTGADTRAIRAATVAAGATGY